MTRRSFGSDETTSAPSSVTITRSSIRTPTAPGTYTPGSTVTTLPPCSASPPRLPPHAVPRLRRVLALLGEPRPLVDLEPDPVPEPVAEVLGVAGGVDDRARDGVDLAAGRPRPHRGERGLLGPQHEVVDLAVARIHLA